MRITHWFPQTVRALATISADCFRRGKRRKHSSSTYSQLEFLEDRSLLSGLNLINNLLNLPPVGLPDSYTVLEDTPFTATVSILSNDTDPNNDILDAQLVLGPLNGVLNLETDGTFSYHPNLNFTGLDTFLYIPNDGTLTGLLPTLVTLNILPLVNTPPVANNDTFNLSEDTILNLSLGTQLDGVLANDTDANGNLLLANLVTTTQHGTLVFLPTGTFIYTPNANFSGTDSFSYQASDLQSQSNVATVTLVVGATNDPPVAVNDSYSTAIGAALTVNAANGVLSNDSDPENAVLTASVVTSPLNGSLILNANGSFTYTPTIGFIGVDTFTYRASDGTLNSNLATVTINIQGTTNTPPVANNDNYAFNEDSVFIATLGNGVLSNDTDVNGNLLTAVLVSGPSHGLLVFLPDGSFTYTPNANYTGPDSFTYRATDLLSQSNVATVSLTIGAINDPPVAVNDSYATTTNSELTVAPANGVLVNDTDAEGSTLTAATLTLPANGSLTFNANGSFTYTPNPGFTGTDTFTYRANDGNANSNAATVTITVAAGANAAPVAANDAYSLSEDSTLSIAAIDGVLANDTDADGNSLTAVIVNQPVNGTVTLAANGSFNYTPNANFSGTDTFTYQANDGLSNSNVATVTLTVNGSNDAPSAVNDVYATTTNTGLTISAANGVLANDTDSDSASLTATTVGTPGNGSLTLNSNGSFTYTPSIGFVGTDSFTYRASDGITVSNLATVTITVSAVANTAPVAVNDVYSIAEDTTLTVISALGVLNNDTDADADSLTAIIVSQPAHGTLSLAADGSFTYTPAANYSGPDSFTYQASDGFANSNVGTVSLNVTGANDSPTAVADNYSTPPNVALTVNAANGVLANDSDIEGSGLTAAVVQNPPNGTLTLNADGSFTYTPNVGFIGVDSFTYQASDGSTNSGPTTVTITVAATSNASPVANNDSYTFTEDTILTVLAANGVLANDTDINGDTLAAVIISQPAHGTVTLSANGAFVYTPNANFSGSDSFTYQASDGSSTSNVATVNLTVTGVNDSPVIVSDSYSTTPDTPFVVSAANGVLANDSDPDSNPLTASVVSTTPNGTLVFNPNGSFTYTPNVGFNGVDVFTYQISDGTVTSGATTVSITVAGAPNTSPVAVTDSYAVTEDTPLTTNIGSGVLANDMDADGDPLTASIVTQPSHGTIALAADGSFVYTPDANYSGSDSFSYQANDGSANSNIVAVNLTISAVSDEPIAVADAYSTDEDSPLTVLAPAGVLSNDTDPDSGNSLTAVLVTNPTNGDLTLNPDGSLTYTPDAGFSGNDTFTYRVNDGTSNSNTVTVTITVNSVNDLPVSVADSYAVAEDTPLTVVAGSGVLANDTDADGDVLTAAIVSTPLHGTVTLNPDGSFVYTPNANFNGIDSFTYRANDGTADGSPTTVTITVGVAGEAPVVTTSAGRQTAKGRKRIVIDPAVNLTDGDSTNFNGGTLDITVQTGVGSKDTLGYRRGGANRGQVNAKKGTLRIGKVVVGSITGGLRGAPLRIVFNSNATIDRVKTVMQNATFRGSKATAGPRTIGFQVKDETGLSSNIGTKGVDVV